MNERSKEKERGRKKKAKQEGDDGKIMCKGYVKVKRERDDSAKKVKREGRKERKVNISITSPAPNEERKTDGNEVEVRGE